MQMEVGIRNPMLDLLPRQQTRTLGTRMTGEGSTDAAFPVPDAGERALLGEPSMQVHLVVLSFRNGIPAKPLPASQHA